MSEDVADYVTFEEGTSDETRQKVLDTAVLDLSAVDASQIGAYTATVTYNKTSLTFTVEVQDTTAPVGTLANEIAEVQTGDEVKAADLVTGVEDAQEVAVEFVPSTLESVDFDAEAQAENAEEAEESVETDTTDAAGNEAVKEAKLTVSVKPAPKPATSTQPPAATTGESDSSGSGNSGGGNSSGSSSSSNSGSDSSSNSNSSSDSSTSSGSSSGGSSSESSGGGDVIKNSDSWGNVSGQGTLFGGLPDE